MPFQKAHTGMSDKIGGQPSGRAGAIIQIRVVKERPQTVCPNNILQGGMRIAFPIHLGMMEPVAGRPPDGAPLEGQAAQQCQQVSHEWIGFVAAMR